MRHVQIVAKLMSACYYEQITSDEVVHLSEPNSESECNENGASDIVDSKLENTDKELLDPLLKPS